MADPAEVLMNPDFGAFGGLKINQTSALKGLEAQETLGKIAMQPAQQRLAEGHARLYESLAAEHEESAAAQKRLGELMKGLPPGGSDGEAATPEALAKQMAQLSKMAFDSGLVKQGTELAGKAATVLQHVASAEASQASADLRDTRRKDILLDMVGGLAQSGMQSQEAYDAARLAAANDPVISQMLKDRGLDLTKMPTDVNKARPALQALVEQTMKAKDLLAQKTRDRTADAETAKDRAQAGAAAASAVASKARAKVLDLQVRDVEKNGGDTTGGARGLRAQRRQALSQAREDKIAALEAKNRQQASIDAKRFAPPTAKELADPSAREPGRTYSTPKGPMTWTGRDWQPLREAPAKPVSQLSNKELDDLLSEDEEDAD